MSSVLEWTCDDVSVWMCENGFTKYSDYFCEEHHIDGAALLTLSEEDLRQPPLELKVLGDIKNLLLCIKKLQAENEEAVRLLCLPRSPSNQRLPDVTLNRRQYYPEQANAEEEEEEADIVDGRGDHCNDLQPEYTKLLASYVYMFSVFLLTAFVMAIVHDRVPDMKKYPPLPDIVLDNMPYIPWAFDMCELIGIVLSSIWFTVLFFHKHRYVFFVMN